MSAGLSLLGYLIAGGGALCLIGMVIAHFEREAERHDDIARAASGMDEFSAPEGGEPR